MRYRLVILDFDGTLADSFAWFVAAVNDAAVRYRFRQLGPEQADLLRSHGAREVMRHLGIPSWKLPLLARYFRRRKSQDLHSIALFPGAGELLRRLDDAGVMLAIVSSNAEDNVRRILGPENVRRIRWLECGASIFGKRRRFMRVVRRSGRAAEEAICIGDEIRDLESAREAGIAFGAVEWGYTRPHGFDRAAPDARFTTMDAIADYVTGDLPQPDTVSF